MKKNELPLDPLIKSFDSMASKHLSDEFLAIAHNIESALIETGAVPGKDYSYLDLFKLTQPFVLKLFDKDANIIYDYPAKRVVDP